MVETADVVVIGGGVIGTSIACALASAGVKRVTLLEKSALASGASGRSSALIRMHYRTSAPPPTSRRAVYASPADVPPEAG